MSDDLPDGTESDIRRRAALFLGMLVLVTILFIAVFVVFFNGSKGGNGNNADVVGPTSPIGSAPATTPGPSGSTSGSGSPTGSGAPTSPSASSTTSGAAASCPGDTTCALDTDIGNAVAAINAYRTQNGKAAVPGSVSDTAKQCALNNGDGCSGGWAETQVDKPDGAAAVQKILQFGKLTSDMKSIEVGWAYDPKAKQYYFAIIRQT